MPLVSSSRHVIGQRPRSPGINGSGSHSLFISIHPTYTGWTRLGSYQVNLLRSYYFAIFFRIIKNLLSVPVQYDACLYLAAVAVATPAKYECDSKEYPFTFAKSKMSGAIENGEINAKRYPPILSISFSFTSLHWDNHTIIQVPTKQPWSIWVIISSEYTKNYWYNHKIKGRKMRIIHGIFYTVLPDLGPL